MKKTLLEVYGLAVCFFTVACFVIVLGIAAWNTISLISPEFTLPSYEWARHQTDENFSEWLISQNKYGATKDSYVPPEGEALTKARTQSYELVIRSHARDAFQSLIQNGIIIFIDMIVFVVHWTIATRARKSAN